MKVIKDESGFTITELIIVLVMTTLLIDILMFFTFYFWRYSYVLSYSQESFVQRLNANDFIRESVGSAVGLISQNSLPDEHTNLPDPDNETNLFWKPIHAVPGTYAIDAEGEAVPLIYYRRYSFDASGNYIYNGTQPYEDEYILYLDSASKKVMARTIANPYAPNNQAITSCPPAQASSTCPADKELIAEVTSVALRYFSRSGNPIDWKSVWEEPVVDPDNKVYIGPDFPAVEVVEMTLNVQRNALFSSSQSTQNSTIVRVSLRNY